MSARYTTNSRPADGHLPADWQPYNARRDFWLTFAVLIVAVFIAGAACILGAST